MVTIITTKHSKTNKNTLHKKNLSSMKIFMQKTQQDCTNNSNKVTNMCETKTTTTYLLPNAIIRTTFEL